MVKKPFTLRQPGNIDQHRLPDSRLSEAAQSSSPAVPGSEFPPGMIVVPISEPRHGATTSLWLRVGQ